MIKSLKLILISLISITGCQAQNGGTISEKQLISKTAKIINELCEKDQFSGTILIAKRDSILYESVCGEASKRFHIPNNIDTKFNIGSNNKMFTATAIMQLVEKKHIKLDDRISKYVDKTWLSKKITDKITIHQLLTHSSGLGDFFNDDFIKTSKESFRNLEDYKPLVKNETLAFEPGSKAQYSNTGMLLLGVIIENVSKKSYFEYISENIYKPLNMNNTDCYEMDLPVENLAIGYSKSENELKWENNLYKHVIKGGPSGGGFSTVKDLHKFGQSILEKKLLSEKSLETLLKIHERTGRNNWENYGYGYGFIVIEDGDNKIIGHVGGFYGISAGFFVSMNNGYVICILSNYEGIAIETSVELSKLILKI